MFSNYLKNQLNLFFENLKTIFLNLNVPSFQITIGGIKTLWEWNENLIGEVSDEGGLTFDRERFGHFLTDEGE